MLSVSNGQTDLQTDRRTDTMNIRNERNYEIGYEIRSSKICVEIGTNT